MFEISARQGKYLGQAARMLVERADATIPIQHDMNNHRTKPVMTYKEFSRERQQTLFAGGGKAACAAVNRSPGTHVKPITVTILTGFLGAGKTTSAPHPLNAEHGYKSRSSNEFGESADRDALIRRSLQPASPR